MVNPFVSNQFDLLPEILHEPFLVNTPIGDSVMAEGVCIEVDGIVASLLKLSWVSLGSNLKTKLMLFKRLDIFFLILVYLQETLILSALVDLLW